MIQKGFLALIVVLCIGCKAHTKQNTTATIFDKVLLVEDSITVGKMTIHNAFKQQILAHRDNQYDSLIILKKVYEPNKYAFDNCLGMIFGDANSLLFKPKGLYDWNRNLLANESIIREKLAVLDSININTLFTNHLTAVQKITGHTGEGKWLVYFGPKDFQIFGGCDNNSMILDMFGDSWNTQSINKVFAHELEHLIFGPLMEKDPVGKMGLGITMDEGLAVYFTYIYLKQNREDALYGSETQLLMSREKEIFEKLEPYFFKTNEEGCPIFRHCGRNNDCKPLIEGLSKEVENELCYFMGFRIIEEYVKIHGKDSWKDIYNIPISDFYQKSGYKEYIATK